MISTASIEPSNPVNADLSWKTVTKGFRSATRRPRKMNRNLNMSLQHDDKGSEEEPSESEEFGLAVLGHRFSEKIDHLPIKKRRPARQSPLPGFPLDQWCGDAGPLDCLWTLRTSMPNEKSVVNKKPPCSEDSYGIELLAAAACNTSINDEILNVKAVKVEEKFEALPQSDSSINVTLLEETFVCSQKKNSLLKDIGSEAHDDPKVQNNSPAVSGDIRDKSDTDDGKGSSSGKDVRLHWDLNTVMDEWELPSKNRNTNSPRNGSVDVHTEGLHGRRTVKLEGSDEHVWESLKYPSETEASAHVVGASCTSRYPDSGLSSGLDLVPNESPFKETANPPTTKMAVKVEENHFLGSDLQLGQTLVVENVQLGKHDVDMADSTISERSMCGVVRINNLSELPNDTNTTNLMGTTFNVEDPSCKSGKGLSFGKGGDLAWKLEINVPLEVGPSVGSSSEIESKKLELKCCEHSGEDALEDLDDGDVSDYSPGGHHQLIRAGKMSKYQSGCESPVEDGELRESIAYSWQENEDETDCVDYYVDDRDAADDFGNHFVSVAGSGSNQIDANGKSPDRIRNGKNYFLNKSSRSVTIANASGLDIIPNGCVRVAKTVEANNVKVEEVGASDSGQKGSVEGKVGSRETRGKLSTNLQGSSGSGAFDGKDTRDGQRRSGACFQDGQVYRYEKYCGRDRPVPWMQYGSHKNKPDVDVSGKWDSRNHYQNGYRRGSGNPRLRSSNIPDANDDELAYDDQRRCGSNYLRDGYRPLDRRRPPDDSHNSMNRGNFVTRDSSHYRSRGRSGFYRRGFVKGNRDEFHDPIADDSAPSSVRVPHNHSARRQINTSPVYNRDTSFSHLGRKSPLRLRSRSPVPWHLQRERNMGTRRISRSPDLRSEGRMGRNRMRYDESKFLENSDGFSSPPRRGFVNEQNSGPNRFRERSSPRRFFGQSQRFGSNCTVGRMKTDDGFRPRLNSERFSEQSGGGWRVHNNNSYDGSDSEKARYNSKHEMIRRVRHSDAGGAGRRFRNDADDCLESHNTRNEYNNNNNNKSCIRSFEKSDGNSWKEGRRHFKHDGDRMYCSGSKVPGIRDCDDDVSAS